MKRNLIMGGVAVVALTVAGVLLFRGDRVGGVPRTLSTYGICLECKTEGITEYPFNQRLPAVCPKCSQRAVYTVMYCDTCKRRFVPELVKASDGGPPAKPVAISCPSCGKKGAPMPYDPENPEQTPIAGPPKLPKWPPK